MGDELTPEVTRPPRCVAKIERLLWKDEVTSQSDSAAVVDRNYFKTCQWTADGTTIIATSADNFIRTFIVPENLLEERLDTHRLAAYSTITATEPVNAVGCYPFFNLQDSLTTFVLSSVREHPIRLNSALDSALVASYPLVNPTTEAFVTASSLLFVPNGTHFIAGCEHSISIFDISRPGQDPLRSFKTGPKSRHTSWSNPGTDMRGIVSALAVEPSSDILAAGTLTRHVGLYDSAGQGECIGVFSVEETHADKAIGGRGIIQMLWSPCGRYLYIAERKSDGIIIYDIRKTGQLLGWTEGRNARTNQRLGVDLAASANGSGHEIWAGGTDGSIRMWKDPHEHVGAVTPSHEWQGHADLVSGVTMHPGGSVLASSSGQRHLGHGDLSTTDEKVEGDNSLKIWAL